MSRLDPDGITIDQARTLQNCFQTLQLTLKLKAKVIYQQERFRITAYVSYES